MAKVNPVKLKQEADKLEKAGRLDQAISLYRQVVEDNPRDWNTVNKIGDLYAKLNKNREASVEYAKVADFYAKDGFLLKAIAIWKKINKLDASALEPYMHLAELYAKQGLMMEAKGQYQVVVDEHVKRGRTRDAGDVLKKMAEIDPGDLKVRSRLADLYTRDGDVPRAVDEHVAIAEELNKKGHLAEALQVLEKGLKLDPRNARLRLELGRVHMVQKNFDKAAHFLEEAAQVSPKDPEVLARLGEAHLGARHLDKAEKVFRRLLDVDPGGDEARTQMGRLHLLRDAFDQAYEQFLPLVEKLLSRKEGDKAAGLLQQIVQKNPSHIASLVKLAEIYGALSKESLLLATYSQLTEAYLQRGQQAEAAAVLEALVAREPQNQQHRSKLELVRSKLPPGARPAAAPPRPAPRPAAQEEKRPAPPPARPPAPARPSAPAPAAADMAGPLAEEAREFIEEHLAEGRVFRKYGLADKAVDQFEAVVARFPENVEARQELRDLYKEKGQPARAAEHLRALAEVFRLKGDEAAAKAHESEARDLMAASAPAAGRPQAAAPAPAAPPAPAVPAATAHAAAPPPPVTKGPARPPAVEEQKLSFEEGEGLSFGADEEEIPLDVEEEPAGTAVPESESEPSLEPLEIEAEAGDEELAVEFLEEETEEPALELVEEPEPPPVKAQPPPARQAEPKPQPVEPPAAPAQPPAREPAAAAAARPAPPSPKPEPPRAPAPPSRLREQPWAAAGSLPSDLARVLDEVEQYLALGFLDDAKEALADLDERDRNHPELVRRLSELGLDVGAAAGAGEEEAGLDLEVGEEAPELSPAAAGSADDDIFEAGEEEAGRGEADLMSDMPPVHAGGARLPPEPAGGESLDLGAELDELFAAHAAVEEPPAQEPSTELGDAGLSDIFKEFKKGVDKQLGKEDYDTRYNLGIAYKEMGLLDEAIAEFQLAAKDDRRLLECASMLGICFLEKGMPKLAVKWFEKGLKVPGRADEEYQGLRYDLAMAYEADGERELALGLFTDLYGQDANFRDVAAKVRELGGAPS